MGGKLVIKMGGSKLSSTRVEMARERLRDRVGPSKAQISTPTLPQPFHAHKPPKTAIVAREQIFSLKLNKNHPVKVKIRRATN
jgi:hypothetical protein